MKKYWIIALCCVLVAVLGVAIAENVLPEEGEPEVTQEPVETAEAEFPFDVSGITSEMDLRNLNLEIPEDVTLEYLEDVLIPLVIHLYQNCEEITLPNGQLLVPSEDPHIIQRQLYGMLQQLVFATVPEKLLFRVNDHIDQRGVNSFKVNYIVLLDEKALAESGYESLTEWVMAEEEAVGKCLWNEAESLQFCMNAIILYDNAKGDCIGVMDWIDQVIESVQEQ